MATGKKGTASGAAAASKAAAEPLVDAVAAPDAVELTVSHPVASTSTMGGVRREEEG